MSDTKNGPLPCPFCGSSETYMERGDFDYSYQRCNDCGARGPGLYAQWDDDEADEARCAKLWNARSAEDFKTASAQVDADIEEIDDED